MKKMLFFLVVLSFFTSCNESKKKESSLSNNLKTNVLDDEHNAENSLDWAGTYQGLIPCADCQGTKAKLVLKEDMTFFVEFEDIVENPEWVDDNYWSDEGKFSWEKGSYIVAKAEGEYENVYVFFVAENAVYLVDSHINPEDTIGEIKEEYKLSKI